MGRFGEQGSTLLIVVPADDQALINELKSITNDLPAHLSFILLHDNGRMEELGFDEQQNEFVLPHFSFKVGMTPEAEQELAMISARQDKMILMGSHLGGLLVSAMYHHDQKIDELIMATDNTRDSFKDFATALADTQPARLQLPSAQYRTPPGKNRGGKKGRGFADPRNRVIT